MSRTILLADDSVTIQKVIELTFMEEDYDVLAVSDGDEALEKLGETSPDIVIADVHMPGASGLDVCRRSKVAHPDIPVLLLVGTFEPFDEAEAEAAGADAHLKKPFDSQELLQRVGELMSGDGPAGAAGSEADPAAAGGEELGTDLGDLDLELADTAGEGADEGASDPDAGTSDWGFDASPATEEPPSVVADAPASSGAETVRTDFGDTDFGDTDFGDTDWGDADWRESSQQEVEGPPATGQREEPAPVRGVADAELAAEEPVAFAVGDAADESVPAPTEEAADDETVGEEDALGAAEPEESAEDSDWGFEMASRIGEGPADDEAGDAAAGDAAAEEAASEDAASEDVAATGADAELAAETSPRRWPPEPPPEDIASAASEEGAPAAPATDGSASGLDDDDVDRIARRVAELLGDRVAREVAWEVIPDLAEVVIRERLRELEGQLD